MRIGFDLDGVLANFIDFFLEEHNRAYGTALSREDVKEAGLHKLLNITKEEEARRIDRAFLSAHNNIQSLSEEVIIREIGRGNDIFVVTARPFSYIEQTRDWIGANFPNIFKDVYFSTDIHDNPRGKTKAQYCRHLGLDFYVEDTLKYAVQCAENGTKVLLMDSPWNKCSAEYEKEHRIKRVFSCKEVQQAISSFSQIKGHEITSNPI